MNLRIEVNGSGRHGTHVHAGRRAQRALGSTHTLSQELHMGSKIIFPTLLLAGVLAQPALAATRCEDLAASRFSDATLTQATEVAAGAFVPADGGGRRGLEAFRGLPAFCRVAGVIRPSADSNIRFEVWMPLQGWNGRFQGVGNGGLAGTISYPAMAAALADGYATGSTDTGHGAEGGMDTAEWALGHPERITDFGYRAVHEMTAKSKAVTAVYYGSPPRYSYWVGCSEGGRQGMGEAQRYPADYDGIVAGAPVFGFTRTQTRSLGLQKILREDPAAFISGSKLKMLHEAVLAGCDALDGVKDRVLTDPRACKIDFAALQCKAGDRPDCLTASQVKFIRADYAGSSNPRTGERLMWGHAPGFELMLGARTGFRETPDADALVPSAFWRYFVFDDPRWDGRSFDFDKDVAFADRKVGGAMNNFDPDLRAFRDRGGKLLHYHGWWDPQPTPFNSIDYFERVQKSVGRDSKDFYRLFMVPGMGHCGGGPGTDQFDKIGTIRAWVEEGKAPGMILAEHRSDGKAERSRPLCPHPQVAKYQGSGSTDVAGSFVCAMP
jgi:feruloyl esterase